MELGDRQDIIRGGGSLLEIEYFYRCFKAYFFLKGTATELFRDPQHNFYTPNMRLERELAFEIHQKTSMDGKISPQLEGTRTEWFDNGFLFIKISKVIFFIALDSFEFISWSIISAK